MKTTTTTAPSAVVRQDADHRTFRVASHSWLLDPGVRLTVDEYSGGDPGEHQRVFLHTPNSRFGVEEAQRVEVDRRSDGTVLVELGPLWAFIGTAEARALFEALGAALNP